MENTTTKAKQGFLNKTLAEQNNGSARVMYILVHFLDQEREITKFCGVFWENVSLCGDLFTKYRFIWN